MFVDPGVKVNGQYYRDVLPSHQMIPAIKQVAGDTFVFQQDSAPAHRTRDTIQLLQRERRLTSLVLTSGRSGRPTVQTWIPSTKRFGASAAGVWITRQQRWWAEATSPWRLAWCAQDIIDLAVSQWRQRLRACVRAHGRHFEHLLCNTNLRWKPICANKLLLNFVY